MLARLRLLFPLLCGVALLAGAAELAAGDKSATANGLLVDDFDGDIQNSLGGFRSPFAASPSSAKALRTEEIFHRQSGKSLRLDVDRREAGFCGAWVHFFDMHAHEPRYFDASGFAHLSFWVRGDSGGETFDVQLADKNWIRKEDSLRLGEISDFLPGGITTSWQEVLVPLQPREGLDLKVLGGLTLNFPSQGKATIYVDDVSFKRRSNGNNVEILPSRQAETRQGPARSPHTSAFPRALWVWTTNRILADETQCRELLDFCEEERINQLWMQLEYKMEPGGLGAAGGEPRCVIASEQQWRIFLRSAHRRKIRVDALDGAPEYAVKENHHVPLAVVDGVIQFNAASRPDERFDGIHFDNEPYLLLGWEDQKLRERILEEFLQLNAECQRRVNAARRSRDELRFGVDIPFWWQEMEEQSAGFPGDVTFQGRRQPASFHCLDLLDVVGIMNYRDTADGPDGMIYHGRGILRHRSENGAAQVYMGIETIRPEPAEVQFVIGLPREQFRAALHGDAKHFANLCRLHGLRLNRFDDGKNVHIGIELPKKATAVQRAAAAQALLEVARHFGIAASFQSPEHVQDVASRAAAAIGKSGEWREFAPSDIRLLELQQPIPGFKAMAIMPSKCTFAEETPAELRLQTSLAEGDFMQFPSYRGLAIHSYESYRPKVAQEKSPSPPQPVNQKPQK